MKYIGLRQAILLGVLTLFCICIYFVISSYRGVHFSRASGFYEEGFKLILSGPPGAKIYYTLDGTIPGEKSILYENGINVYDATSKPNKYSMIKETTLNDMKDELKKISDDRTERGLEPLKLESTWNIIPNYNVDKCFIVSAFFVDIFGHKSNVCTEVYFIGYQEKNGYDNTYILSLTIDPMGLFSKDKGIYVLGDKFKDYDKAVSPIWQYWGGNFDLKGAAWERRAVAHLFDSNHKIVFKKNIGIRIQGNSSRKMLPKNLNLYARNIYDGNRFFPDVFETGYHADKLTLFFGSQDYATKIRDALVNELVWGKEVCVCHYQPCTLFLDGEYWGLYFLKEKFDESYLSYYYNVHEKNVSIIKMGTVEEGPIEALDDYQECFDFLNRVDMQQEKNYRKASELIDIQSMADYYAIMIYIARYNDWPSANFEMWKTVDKENGKYGDGKWRWMIYDLNSGSSRISFVAEDSIKRVREKDALFNNFCKNKKFIKIFVNSMLSIMNDNLSSEKVDEMISVYERVLSDPMAQNNRRFYGMKEITDRYEYNEDGDSYHDKMNTIKTFYSLRRDYMMTYLIENFGEIATEAMANEETE